MNPTLWNNGRISLCATLLAALLAGCCHLSKQPDQDTAASPNQKLLDEVNKSDTWFHARKTRPIWAKKLDRQQTVETLEGQVQADAGDFLCRGEQGEVWPQKAKNLEAKYTATDVMDAEGWRKYEPRPDAEGVMAAPVAHPFVVEASWGTLSGKAGDYVIKNFRDRAVAYPKDVWIVDRQLFHATYEAVRP